jgi:hypothetical protein
VAGAAADARKTPGTTRHATWTPELATGPATATREAALPTCTATWTPELATGAAVTVDVAAAPAWVLLEDHMRGRRASRGAGGKRLSCCNRSHSNRCGSSSTNHQRFRHTQFREHKIFLPPSTRVQNIQNVSSLRLHQANGFRFSD